MKISRYSAYLENYVNPVKADLKKFDGKVKHKIVASSSGETFNVWIAEDAETSIRLTRLYAGKHALDLGGYAPSVNDVWLEKDGFVAIVKTNKDDIVPRDVLLDVANILRRRAETHKDETDTVEVCKSPFVSVKGGEVVVDEKNSGRIYFTPGNLRFEL